MSSSSDPTSPAAFLSGRTAWARSVETPLREFLHTETGGVYGRRIELVTGASPDFDRDAFLAGAQTPVFFGSAINNFGVQEILQALIDWAPSPQPREAGNRIE